MSPSQDFDAILIVVNRFTKMTHFLSYVKSITSQVTIEIIMREVFWHHGLLDDIISDCGLQFISHFWKHLCDGRRIFCKHYSAYHLETDGQTEHTNQTHEQHIWCFISYQQDDWSSILSLAEYTYNNIGHSSTKVTHFYAYTGTHPPWCHLQVLVISPNSSAE
jgi:hypothetical protein